MARARVIQNRWWVVVVLAAWQAAALPAVGAESPAAQAESILTRAKVSGGLIVDLGCGRGELTAALGKRAGVLVLGLDTDAGNVAAARACIARAGRYGPVLADRLVGKALPLGDNLANLVVAEDLCGVSQAEVMRVLCPGGVALVRQGDSWKRTVKPRPDALDEWTHYLHGPDGNPVAHDTAVGPPRRLQWVGSPRWARHHDHMASMTSLVAAGGRLFYIMDEGPTASIQLPSNWQLVARDAFNGTILWQRPIKQWNTRQWPLKSGPAILLRRLVAEGDRVYVTLGLEAPLTALDAATGETVRTYKGSERTREIVLCGDTLLAVVGLAPSRLPEWRRRHSYVWDNTRLANKDWAWGGDKRTIRAYDPQTGAAKWSYKAPVAPCSLAADAKHVVFHDGEKLICLARADGKKKWVSEPIRVSMPVLTCTGVRTLLAGDVVLVAGNTGRITALSDATGKTLWEGKQYPSGHQSLKDLMVVNGVVWTGAIANGKDSGLFTGYDVKTGKVVSEFRPDVKIYWFHHRCYPAKATDKYLLTSRTGIEFIDPAKKHWETHHWVRGGCIYGIMPCNGLIYAPMHSCGCYLESKLCGFNALAPAPVPQPTKQDLSDTSRLEKGPAYAKAAAGKPADAAGAANLKSQISNLKSAAASPSQDWPTYRHDPGRSGSTGVAVPSQLKQAWRVEIGGRLSPPVIAGGRVFLAAIDAHTVYALDAATGKQLWKYTAGGRVDSPPTIYRGLVLFGSADGYVYAVNASDGQLAWRYRAAPLDRRMVAYEQVESAWPVHGSVLVEDGVAYCTAGRSIFLDGGIRVLRLDPLTGRKLGETVWNQIDPDTGKNMQTQVQGLNMPVALSDVLSSDGTFLYMRSQKFDHKGKRIDIPVQRVELQPKEGSHLFCQIGFLDDTWFHRSFWTYGRRVTGGYGGWFQAGRVIPAGRILVYDKQKVYGYGRKPEYYVNASVLEYQLFASDKNVTEDWIARIRHANQLINRRSPKRNANSSDWKARREFKTEDLTAAHYRWRLDQPGVQVRAMAAGADTLVVAGHPDFIDERRAYRLPDDKDVQERLRRQAEALAGTCGGQLWLLGKADGKARVRYRLASPPVFDGLAIAGGRVVMVALDGSVLSLAADGVTPLTQLGADTPMQVISDEPKEPSVLRAPEVDKSADFQVVRGCRVTKSKLGYRLRPKGERRGKLNLTGFALNKLAQPITGQATLTTTLRVPGESGFLVNGFIALGQATEEAKLIKCGIRFQPQKAMVVQGPLAGKGKTTGADIKAAVGSSVPLTVQIDLKAGQITFTAGKAVVRAKIATDMKAITHVGFCMDSAVAEFSPLKVTRK